MVARSVSTARSASSLSSPFDSRASTGRQSQRQHHDYELAHGVACASHTHPGEEAGTLIAAWRLHGCELGFGARIAQGFATLGQIGFSERSGYTAIGTVCNL